MTLIGLGFLAVYVLQLKSEWTVNPHYSFGWAVPFLGIMLFARRWKDRPAVSDSPARLGTLACGALALWLPLRILREANMDWRLLEWVIGGGVVLAVLLILAWCGGMAWVRHFAVPVGFLLVAVPWPSYAETEIARVLSLGITKAVVEALRWMGVAAWSAGNLIQMPGTTLGVDEACSGIRALQGSLMGAIFLGELRRLSFGARSVLILAAVVIAVALNFARTFWLAAAAAREGTMGVARWHDGAGYLALLGCFAVLWLLARRLRAGRGHENTPPNDFREIPARFVVICLGWLLAVEAATFAWYSGAPDRSFSRAEFRPMAGLEAIPISERVRTILRFDKGAAYQRKTDGDMQWWIYHIQWDAASAGANLARYHAPEICLPAAGFRPLEAGKETVVLAAGVPFRFLKYQWIGRPVFVFSSFRSANTEETVRNFKDFDLTWSKRARAAFRGERAGAKEVVQVVISGASSESRAEAAFLEFAQAALSLNKG